MGLNEILLVCAALIPAIILCIYVFKKDRVEKEPIGLLLLLLVLGVAICFPAAELEELMFKFFNAIFSGAITIVDGQYYIDGFAGTLYGICTNFIGIALVEEGLKFLVLFFVTRKSKEFNCLFDGIIYSVFVSLGFAAYENILYVLRYGWTNAVMRGILSVPGHMFFAVLMGYYYTMWHIDYKAKEIEIDLQKKGLLDARNLSINPNWNLCGAIIIPVLAHGWYDYLCTSGSMLDTLLFYGFIIFLYIYCFSKIKNSSKMDLPDDMYSWSLVFKEHPNLKMKIESIVRMNQINETVANNTTEKATK